ncbi:hypothetical protein ACH5RR_030997 [Cinchona calisaya]|uniref:Uncharacterized protein n=1 Tax=Cinchona calisaya TaxID=153742 RepID=A0ABD2YI92_9GENT
MKKILLVLFVALVLILGSFQANAKRVLFQERQLLSDANLGRKVSAGPNDKVVTQTKGADENPELAKTKNGSADNTVTNGAVTRNNDNYGEDSDSNSHRYFSDDQHQPKPSNNNANSLRPTP